MSRTCCGVAQVGRLAAGHVAQDLGVALATGCHRGLLRRRARSGELTDEPLHHHPVDGQATPLELEAHERSRGLRVDRADRPSTQRLGPISLSHSAFERCFGPPQQVVVALEPAGCRVRAQVAVGSHELVRAHVVTRGEVEEVTCRRSRHRRDRYAVRSRPHASGIGVPSAVEDPVGLGEVPGASEGGAERGSQLAGIPGGPPDPPRSGGGLQPGHLASHVRERPHEAHAVTDERGAATVDDGGDEVGGAAGRGHGAKPR